MANKVFITTNNYTNNARYEYIFPTQVEFKEGDTIEMQKLIIRRGILCFCLGLPESIRKCFVSKCHESCYCVGCGLFVGILTK